MLVMLFFLTALVYASCFAFKGIREDLSKGKKKTLLSSTQLISLFLKSNYYQF